MIITDQRLSSGRPVQIECGRVLHVKIVSIISENKPEVMGVRDLETGKLQCLIVNVVLRNELRAAYANDGYVGRCFQIEKFKPQGAKLYATFKTAEIELAEEFARQLASWESEDSLIGKTLQSKLAKRGAFPSREEYESFTSEEWQVWYSKYLHRKLWKTKIKPRILERDNNRCRKCGGRAHTVHHRSYDYDVISGEGDEQLVAICEGCHNFIHYDDIGAKRNSFEIDRLLLQKDIETCVPPRIDGRTRFPPQWKRMSAAQRSEYDKLWVMRKLQRDTPQQIERNRIHLRDYWGLDDAAIDSMIEKASVRCRKKSE